MEPRITLPLFVEFSASLLSFLLVVSLFFYYENAETHEVMIGSGSTVTVEVAQPATH